ncbi:DUF3301 domain-containing protein [Thauera sinica]|uniref:DUF3301 domain-containing protein n=1 Tax=Thauera sinica TaxID=2665146 RepID=A0ABW1AQJ8_9RHOO|nr:DUF3301 domain-containing protein [Thauera sp. K11]ATE62507.1 hypothetical protein CCZ27_06030 [Thauera sp. K11]
MSFPELLALLALGLLVWFWFDSLQAREAGVAAARVACRREGLQFLDETVVGRGLRPVRDEDGRLVLQRAFEFEYSRSGYDRFHGSVVLRGRDVVLLDVGAWRLAQGGLSGPEG